MGYKARKRRERSLRRQCRRAEAQRIAAEDAVREIKLSISYTLSREYAGQVNEYTALTRSIIEDVFNYVATRRGRLAVLFKGKSALADRVPLWKRRALEFRA